RAIGALSTPVGLFGHTHVAICAILDAEGRFRTIVPQGHPELQVRLEASGKYLINPGSVGQPRDGDSRAAYAIADMDNNVVTVYRVVYPIETAQKKIIDAGLPAMLAYRLGMGR